MIASRAKGAGCPELIAPVVASGLVSRNGTAAIIDDAGCRHCLIFNLLHLQQSPRHLSRHEERS